MLWKSTASLSYSAYRSYIALTEKVTLLLVLLSKNWSIITTAVSLGILPENGDLPLEKRKLHKIEFSKDVGRFTAALVLDIFGIKKYQKQRFCGLYFRAG